MHILRVCDEVIDSSHSVCRMRRAIEEVIARDWILYNTVTPDPCSPGFDQIATTIRGPARLYPRNHSDP